MTKQTEAGHETPIDLRVLWDMNGSSLEVAEKTYRNWMTSAGRLQNETLGFLNGRFEKGLEAARELSACKSPTEYFEVQARYADRAMSDWLEQSQKIVQLFSDLTMQAAHSAEEAVQAGAHATPTTRRTGRAAGRSAH